MAISPSDQIKDSVSLSDAVRYYGFNPNVSGFICCPFHHERTASLKLYHDNHWYCFGCHKHGSVIDFVMDLYGLNFFDACKRIASDFGLTLSTERPTHDDVARRIRMRNRQVKRYNDRVNAELAQAIIRMELDEYGN